MCEGIGIEMEVVVLADDDDDDESRVGLKTADNFVNCKAVVCA